MILQTFRNESDSSERVDENWHTVPGMAARVKSFETVLDSIQ